MRWGLLAVGHGVSVLGLGAYAMGLGAYAIGLVAMAPATLIDTSLQRASSDRLRLAEARGTLWSGTGQLEIRDRDGQIGVAKGLAWRLLPHSLLRGQLEYEIDLDQSTRRFGVAISRSRIDIAGAQVDLPAAVLGLGMPKLAPLGLSGDMLLHAEGLSIDRTGLRGDLMLQWRAAGSGFTPVSPFGDYELSLQSDGTTVRASLRTLQGPLHMTGEGSWAYNAPPQFPVTIDVPAQYRQQFVPLLRMISVERGDGSFALQLK